MMKQYTQGGVVYLVDFINRETKAVDFQKFGHTRFVDVADRFKVEPDQYAKWEIRILAKAHNNDIEKVKGAEEAFHSVFPKNLWIEEKIGGVTEIVEMDGKTRYNAIQCVRRLNEKWKKEKSRYENSA
jgi:hypothetical protein